MLHHALQKTVNRNRSQTRRVAVTIRLPEEVVDKIDSLLAARSVPLSRNNWILEAALEKLARSEKETGNGAK